MRVPVDPVELESRLASIERRLAEFEAREQRLMDLIQAVHRLTEAIGPLVKPAQLEPEPPRKRRRPEWPLPAPRASGPRSGGPGPVAPERIALAHARLRETLFAGSPAESADRPTPAASTQPAAQEPDASPAPDSEPPQPSEVRPPGKNSWVLRALKRMAKRDPPAAGGFLDALPPAHALAQLPPIAQLPGPPEALAPLLVKGRVRRRIGWEKARLQCSPGDVSRLIPLARLRATPRQLRDAGVRLDPVLAFTVVAYAIEPGWTTGHRFAIAHQGPERITYLSVHGRTRPAVSTKQPPGPVSTTVCCLDEELFAVLGDEMPAGVSVLGALAPLELVQRWFARATTS